MVNLLSIFNALSDGVIIYDPQGNPIQANSACRQLLGLNPVKTWDEIGTPFSLLAPDGSPVASEKLPIRRALNGEAVIAERYLLCVASQELRLEISANALTDDAGQLTGAALIMRDVTEIERAHRLQAHLEQSNQKHREMLEAIFEAHPAGLAVLSAVNLKFLYCNPAYRSITPHPEVNLIGRHLEEIWPPAEGFKAHENIRIVLESNRPLHLDHIERVYPNGQTRHFAFHVDKIQWDIDPAIILVAWETTEIEKARRQVEQEHARLKTVMEYLPAGIWFTDEKGEIVYGNPAGLRIWQGARYVGIDQFQEYVGWWYDTGKLIAPEEWAVARAVQKGETSLDELIEIQCFDGSHKIILNSAAPMRDEQGNIIGAAIINEDITERIQLQERLADYAARLERSNQELQQFAYVASHDLQEPLRKIESFGERLINHSAVPLPEMERDFLHRMVDASRRMREMVDALLALSRISTFGRPFEPVDLSAVMRQVVSDLEVRITRAAAVVEYKNMPVVEGDPVQFHQLLMNLVGNAIKFQKQGVKPQVQVWTEETPDHKLHLYVKDNGIGFDPALAARLFQPFQRLVGRSEFEGSGIGLAICRKIVERHGGSISVASQKGEGSTFEVVLPTKYHKETEH